MLTSQEVNEILTFFLSDFTVFILSWFSILKMKNVKDLMTFDSV